MTVVKSRDTTRAPCHAGNHDQARTRAAIQRMEQEVGCLVPYIDRSTTETGICTNSTRATVAREIFEAKKEFYDVYSFEKVPLPCLQVTVEPRVLQQSLDWYNNTHIDVKFTKESKFIVQEPAYTFLTFICEVGGIVGLMLGVSVNQIGSLLDIFLEKCYLQKI